FYNWLGCAIGAARHEAADAALAAVQMLEPSPQASVLGRTEKVDMASAALVNGITSHTFDFDDTHLKTIIHPAGPVASAVLALAEHRGNSGREVIDALILGIDVSCRIGNVMYPDHYDRGWHITGSTGMLGAAAGCARLLQLDEQQTAMALGIAASQPVGLREQFGTMTKPFHPGAAARAGLLAALLASRGFTASPRALEAPRGFVQVASDKRSWHEATDALGERFEISFNTYKPFACGIVIHPSIDACVQLRERGIEPDDVERIELRVHSLVLELTGKKSPVDGLQGKFSVYHGCAVGLLYGRAGEPEFADAVVNDPQVVALRNKVMATVDDTVVEEAALVTAIMRDGRQVEVRVDHAIGSLHKPLTDAHLESKFDALVTPVLGAARSREITGICRTLASLADMRTLTSLCRP
ncbi:MAG: MmgE/PrpD family protein, partial [Casimicrobiaceae bacterium]